MLKIGSVFAFLASAQGNIVSPGLGKCMQVHLEPGQTAAQLQQGAAPINVEVTTCTDGSNQHYQIKDGMFESQLLPGMCLTASSAGANANVHLATCVQGSPLQEWSLTSYGNIMLGSSNLCLDIMAGLKADNTRESWDEIKQHNVVNVHLYTCHNPETTDRVNQLWTWAPFKNGQQVTARIAPVATATPVAAASGLSVAPAATASSPVCEDDAALDQIARLQSGVHDPQSSQGMAVSLRQQDVLADQEGNPRLRPGVQLGLEQNGSSMVLEAIAAKGGLIQTFELNKRNILYNRPLPDQMDGSIFWPGPQQAWGWPPPEQIDPTPSGKYDLSYSLEIDQRHKAFTLTSSVAQSVNLQVSKTISMDPGRSAAVLDYAITNTGNQGRSWAPWEIGRVRPHGLTFYMTGASPPTNGTWPALEVVQAAGATWFQHTGAGGKLYADTAEGWLAHTDGELVWVKCFEKIVPGSEAPGENQIEIYDGGDYVEVEQQGAYLTISPQCKLHWRVLWFLREMPPGARATPGDPELLTFTRSLCG